MKDLRNGHLARPFGQGGWSCPAPSPQPSPARGEGARSPFDQGRYCCFNGIASRTGGQSNRRWGSKAIRIGHSLEDSSLRMRKTALSAEILLGSPKTSRSISERNSRKIRLRCIFRRTRATGWSDPVAGWDLHPLKTNTFHTAHIKIVPFVRPGRPHQAAVLTTTG